MKRDCFVKKTYTCVVLPICRPVDWFIKAVYTACIPSSYLIGNTFQPVVVHTECAGFERWMHRLAVLYIIMSKHIVRGTHIQTLVYDAHIFVGSSKFTMIYFYSRRSLTKGSHFYLQCVVQCLLPIPPENFYRSWP